MDKLDAKVGVGPEASRRPGKKNPIALWKQISTWMATPPRQCGPGMHGDLEGPPCVFIFGLQKAGCRQNKGTNAHMCSLTPVRMNSNQRF